MKISMQPVKSSQILAIGYDAANKTLAIQFKGPDTGVPVPGSTYHYTNVEPETFEAMKAAESVGSFFYKNIKANREKYPYKKVEITGVWIDEANKL